MLQEPPEGGQMNCPLEVSVAANAASGEQFRFLNLEVQRTR